MRTLLLSVLLLSTAACDAAVVGAWTSDKKLGNNKKNQLDVFDDQSGEATIYATPETDQAFWVRFEFKVDWEEDAGEFDLKMKCKKRSDAECNSDDFTMACTVFDTEDGVKLDCKGTKDWSKYPFDWEVDDDPSG
jgi:hypothetical protein